MKKLEMDIVLNSVELLSRFTYTVLRNIQFLQITQESNTFRQLSNFIETQI